MKDVLKKLVVGAAWGIVAASLAAASPAMAADKKPGTVTKMYVLYGGDQPKPDPIKEGMPEYPHPDYHPTPSFVIVHGKDALIWETGLNNEEFKPGAPHEPHKPFVTTSLLSQLKAIGYPPSKIKYVIFSHYHGDHSGNANLFYKSTWITQKDMRDAMFGPWPGIIKEPLPNPNDWNKLKDAKTIIIPDKDYDVFGDGSVVVLFTPTNTPGHQSLFVNFRKSGPMVLSGDLYSDSLEHELYLQMTGHKTTSGHVFTPAEIATYSKFVANENNGKYVMAGTTTPALDSMNKVQALLDKTGAKLWVHHDNTPYDNAIKPPKFYD